jgi:hypothetical protein
MGLEDRLPQISRDQEPHPANHKAQEEVVLQDIADCKDKAAPRSTVVTTNL